MITGAIQTADLQGIEGEMTAVECRILHGFPSFAVVGLASASVLESKERIRASLDRMGIKLPTGRIIINLIPGDRRKRGTHWDLPIAVSLLAEMGLVDRKRVEHFAFIGELSLEGALQPIENAEALAITLLENGFIRVILPMGNADACSKIDGLTIYPARYLTEVFDFLRGDGHIEKMIGSASGRCDADSTPDFSTMKGQEPLKRVMQIAAAGRHSVLMIGSPGVGKTMAAGCYMGLLPDLNLQDRLERKRIYSAAGVSDGALDSNRPIQRRPHHTVTATGLLGGGVPIRPGEVTLAHHGVLFLDELPEHTARLLEKLRLPLDSGVIELAHGSGHVRMPADFRFIASMNPCPCGHFGDPKKQCVCSPHSVSRYIHRISKSLLDRIDICIEVTRPEISCDSRRIGTGCASTADLKTSVNEACERQRARYCGSGCRFNGDAIKAFSREKYKLSEDAIRLTDHLAEVYTLSMRSRIKLVLMAQTIADLDERAHIDESAILEAFSYRQAEYKYWER